MYIHSPGMKYLPDFQNEAEEFIRNFCTPAVEYSVLGSKILLAESGQAFNLMEINKYALTPNTMLDISKQYQERNIRIIHLWEDVWRSRNIQVKSVIKAKLGYSKKIYARKTAVVKLTKTELDTFMDENHLMRSALCKYKYGLTLGNDLVAAAAFAPIRKYYHQNGFDKSSELVRYANLNETIVVGGLSRLISFFVNERKPDDIMSYADKDWSDGAAYRLLGFTETEQTPPKCFTLNMKDFSRIPMNDNEQPQTNIIYNTGNIKFKKIKSTN
jgi:hypothetical protein